MTFNEQITLRQCSRLQCAIAAAVDPRKSGVTPGRKRIARDAFERALVALVAAEDERGAAAVAWISDPLTAARQRATEVGLLTVDDVSRIERAATVEA